MNRLKNTFVNIKQWILHLVTTCFYKEKTPKLLPKLYELTCPRCDNKYFEIYEPPKRYIPCCDDCLPF